MSASPSETATNTGILVSIVVPTFNAGQKLSATLDSISSALDNPAVEVIFVDDCSSDDTVAMLEGFCKDEPRAGLSVLPRNSGGASTPRNCGAELARGEYLFFLDSDDRIDPNGFASALEFLKQVRPDVLRSSSKVTRADREDVVVDRVRDWRQGDTKELKLRKIVRSQSLTAACFVRRTLINDRQIRFPTDRRIGEDITFVAACLSAGEQIEYIDVPIREYLRIADASASVTQSLRSRDLRDFFEAWEEVSQLLDVHGVSFLKEHGTAAVRYAIRQYIWFGSGSVAESDLHRIGWLIRRRRDEYGDLDLGDRYGAIVKALEERNREQLSALLRPRILFAGHDLRFLNSIISSLASRADVEIDRWTGHTAHDVEESTRLLAWCDLVFCEWLLGNAVWYSERVTSDQFLIVRAHRVEVEVDFGLRVRWSRVSKVIVIGPHSLDDFSDRFDLPREKFAFVPNAIDSNAYAGRRSREIRDGLNLVMVGAVPRRKGLDRALELLHALRAALPQTTLTIFGRSPTELEWIASDPVERHYFLTCERRMKELHVDSAVYWRGWADLHSELSAFDFLISCSDAEGAQVAPVEAIASGVVPVVLNCRGADRMLPSSVIAESTLEMLEKIETLTESRPYLDVLHECEDAVLWRHDVERVAGLIWSVFLEVAS